MLSQPQAKMNLHPSVLKWLVAFCVLDGVAASEFDAIASPSPSPEPLTCGCSADVIVGAHADWSSAPVTLTLDSTDYKVVSEKYKLMARGLVLADGSVEATITCEDGTVVACMINVQTVY